MNKEVLTQLLPVGTFLEKRYRIEQYLSSGGFGNTYIAYDAKLSCHVAIKEFYLKDYSTRGIDGITVQNTTPTSLKVFDEYKAKFVTEAKRITQLRSDHIVRVIDLFDANGTSYYVMDFIEGKSLKEQLKVHGPMDEATALNITLQLTEALEVVHTAGFYHLDIKPNNVMLTKTGKAILIDFGASKQMETSGGATKHSLMVHTPGFAPSEQMDQRADRIGPWTDFFALGATLYAMLTAKEPPQVSDINDEGTNAFSFPQNVSMLSRQAIIKMMQPATNKRPQNAKEVKWLLTSSLSSQQQNPIPQQMTILPQNGQVYQAMPQSGPRMHNSMNMQSQNMENMSQRYHSNTHSNSKKHLWIWLLVGIFSLGVIALTITLVTKEKNIDLRELVDKAKTEGSLWTEDEWKEAYKDVLTACMPLILETYDLRKKSDAAKTGEELTAISEEIKTLHEKYKNELNLINEFSMIAGNTDIGKRLDLDEDFHQELYNELGIEEIMSKLNEFQDVIPTQEEIESVNAKLPIEVEEGIMFTKVSYNEKSKVQSFFYKFTEEIDETLITSDFVAEMKANMVEAIKDAEDERRLQAGITYLYVYYSIDNKKLYEIKIDMNDLR